MFPGVSFFFTFLYQALRLPLFAALFKEQLGSMERAIGFPSSHPSITYLPHDLGTLRSLESGRCFLLIHFNYSKLLLGIRQSQPCGLVLSEQSIEV